MRFARKSYVDDVLFSLLRLDSVDNLFPKAGLLPEIKLEFEVLRYSSSASSFEFIFNLHFAFE